jgi:hypothetical protein
MEIILGQAHNAVATVRALPFGGSSTTWRPQPTTVRFEAAVPNQTRDRACSMSGVGSYRIAGGNFSAPRAAATTIGKAADVVCVMTDHKFSTRLGLSASPPV